MSATDPEADRSDGSANTARSRRPVSLFADGAVLIHGPPRSPLLNRQITTDQIRTIATAGMSVSHTSGLFGSWPYPLKRWIAKNATGVAMKTIALTPIRTK